MSNYKITYEVRETRTLPDAPADPVALAYLAAWARLETGALSIQAFSGGLISLARAREMAREQLCDADRAALARNAEPVARLMLPAPELSE